MPQGQETIRVACSTCGTMRNFHRVLYEFVKPWNNGPDEPVHTHDYHRLVQCMGCKSLRYVTSTECQIPEYREETDINVYPDLPNRKPNYAAGIDPTETSIPANVRKMYCETLQALNAGINTLAAGGLRATVEAICIDSGLVKGSLQTKIDELARKNLLTVSQADLLHEERYLGNAALHELETPPFQAIVDGLHIVEGLINTIYILPIKATRLRDARSKKCE